MKVRNINGTRDNACKCGGWIEHWLAYSGQSLPGFCPEMNCIERPEVGAHVQKDDPADDRWYIVPLCKKHNAETGKSLEISDTVALVSANVSTTCGSRIGGW